MGTTEKRTKKSGAVRPLKELDKEEFEKLCYLQCTMNEIYAWFGISEDMTRLYSLARICNSHKF